jgi:hypothetical protein
VETNEQSGTIIIWKVANITKQVKVRFLAHFQGQRVFTSIQVVGLDSNSWLNYFWRSQLDGDSKPETKDGVRAASEQDRLEEGELRGTTKDSD